jgi:hypothetical protein
MHTKRKPQNLLEVRCGIVHADGDGGDDYTLCGLTSEKTFGVIPPDYDADYDMQSTEPTLIRTDKKINCSRCASIIRHCCKLGTKSIDKTLKDTYGFNC